MSAKNSILIVVDSCAWRHVTAAPIVASRPAAAQRWRFSELVRSDSFAVVYGSGSAHTVATVVIPDHKDRSHTVERWLGQRGLHGGLDGSWTWRRVQ